MTSLDTQTLALIPNLGTGELVIIFFIILLLFGAKRLPDLFRSFGKSLGEFKRATRDIETDFREAMDSAETTSTPQQPAAKKPEATEAHSSDTTKVS